MGLIKPWEMLTCLLGTIGAFTALVKLRR